MTQYIEGISNTTIYTITTVALLASSLLVYHHLTKPRHSIQYTKLDKKLREIKPLISRIVKDLGLYYDKDTGKYFHGNEKEEDKHYRYNYYQEELLKILIMIDGVEVVDVNDPEEKASLKSRRKEFIKEVQRVMKDIEQYK